MIYGAPEREPGQRDTPTRELALWLVVFGFLAAVFLHVAGVEAPTPFAADDVPTPSGTLGPYRGVPSAGAVITPTQRSTVPDQPPREVPPGLPTDVQPPTVVVPTAFVATPTRAQPPTPFPTRTPRPTRVTPTALELPGGDNTPGVTKTEARATSATGTAAPGDGTPTSTPTASGYPPIVATVTSAAYPGGED